MYQHVLLHSCFQSSKWLHVCAARENRFFLGHIQDGLTLNWLYRKSLPKQFWNPITRPLYNAFCTPCFFPTRTPLNDMEQLSLGKCPTGFLSVHVSLWGTRMCVDIHKHCRGQISAGIEIELNFPKCKAVWFKCLEPFNHIWSVLIRAAAYTEGIIVITNRSPFQISTHGVRLPCLAIGD